jgi:hypothetical protein
MNAVILWRAKLCALLTTTSLSAFALGVYAPAAALAQSSGKQDALPADQNAVIPGGVDMHMGQVTCSHTDLAIGGATSMWLVRDNGAHDLSAKKPFGNFARNCDIFVNEKASGATYDDDIGQPVKQSYQISVTAGGRSKSFTAQYLGANTLASNGTFAGLELMGTPSSSSRDYRYTAADRTVIEFRPMEGRNPKVSVRNSRGAYAAFLPQPDRPRQLQRGPLTPAALVVGPCRRERQRWCGQQLQFHQADSRLGKSATDSPSLPAS